MEQRCCLLHVSSRSLDFTDKGTVVSAKRARSRLVQVKCTGTISSLNPKDENKALNISGLWLKHFSLLLDFSCKQRYRKLMDTEAPLNFLLD